MTKIKMVVFDMAGTTIDEKNVVYKTLYNTIYKYTTEVNLELVLQLGAGKEKHQAIKDVLSFLKLSDQLNSEIIFQEFKKALDLAYQNLDVQAIDGVEAMFTKLKTKNIKLVLNTGYNSLVANQLLEKLNWKKEQHYDALITADDVKNGRPKPDMIYKAMELFGIENPSWVLKAGDSAVDIQEGKNANCGVTVGVLSGAQTKEQLETANPDYILDSLAALDTVINNLK
ncbi:phosphonatase-like hydrolase [Ochrovirga pacifica]|uniref:phosphonatase-like hydrolase n=1 Tax=Ochrovirga pacifica TaxID=1042376 RepID=UPI000498576F|nr:phosphonatase-like hydrolase [Ochrovirga pacifica]